MPARLVALNGASDIVLTGLLTVAGRHASCDAQLPSSRVSRRHCCLAVSDGEVIVRDLGSHNGTWINGKRIEDGILRPGDTLGIAHLKFRLILRSSAGGREAGDPSGLQPSEQRVPASDIAGKTAGSREE